MKKSHLSEMTSTTRKLTSTSTSKSTSVSAIPTTTTTTTTSTSYTCMYMIHTYTNVFGTFRVTQAILPHMREHYGGSIINISSIAGRIGLPLFSAYVSSKFALEGLSESMAYELQPFGIKVAIIEPGSINTNFRSELAAKATKASPYYVMTQSTVNAIEGMVRQGILPKEVAKVVIDAINDPKPKLRYIVGKDAEEFLEASRRLSEQELLQTVSRIILKRRG